MKCLVRAMRLEPGRERVVPLTLRGARWGAYDVGGIAEPVRRFGAGRVVAAGDVAALAVAVHELLSDHEALEQARAGARRAREELTWDAAAQAHLAVYEEIA